VPFLNRLREDADRRYPNPRQGPQPPGKFSYGTAYLQGGPRFSDAFNSKPSPGLPQLIENYGALVYALVERNRNAVAKTPLRLLADGSKAQGGPPARHCEPIPCSRATGVRLAEAGKIGKNAIDQVYEIREHPLLKLLDDPDPYGTFTKEKLIGLLVSMMDVVGGCYLVPEGNGWDWEWDRDNPQGRRKGPPEHLWLLYPQWVIPTRLGRSPVVDTFVYFSDRLPYESVMWFRHNFSLKDVYGSTYSPANAAESYRDQEQRMVAILSQVLGIGPRPDVIASAKDSQAPPGLKEKEALEIDLKRKQAGGYAGGVLVTTGAFDFNTVDYPKADIAARDIGQHDRDNMAAIFGQPATYYGQESNLANLQAADKQHWDNAVETRCKTVAGTFTRLAKMCDQRMIFQFDHGLAEDEEVRQRVIDMQLKSGQATINEVNQDSKYAKKPWGDAPWLPGTMKQPDMLMEAHDQQLEQGQAAIDGQDLEGNLAADAHEHGKVMDKKKLQAGAKPAERSLEELERSILLRIEQELNQLGAA
jgi:hypothetical protein